MKAVIIRMYGHCPTTIPRTFFKKHLLHSHNCVPRKAVFSDWTVYMPIKRRQRSLWLTENIIKRSMKLVKFSIALDESWLSKFIYCLLKKEFAEAQQETREGSLKIVPVIWNLAIGGNNTSIGIEIKSITLKDGVSCCFCWKSKYANDGM